MSRSARAIGRAWQGYLDRGEEGARALGAGLLEHFVEEALDGGVLHVVLLVDDREDDAALGRGDIRLVDCELRPPPRARLSVLALHPRPWAQSRCTRTLPWTMRVTIRCTCSRAAAAFGER